MKIYTTSKIDFLQTMKFFFLLHITMNYCSYTKYNSKENAVMTTS